MASINSKCAGVYCYPELESKLYQGDIMIDDDQRNAIKVKKHLWPIGIVPYIITSAFTEQEKNKIFNSMRFIESKTCIKFIPRTFQIQFIKINREKKGCFSMIGYRPGYSGASPVNLQSPECLYHSGTIQHELLHALGLFHEQARPDRDTHINILWENIDAKYFIDFDKANANQVSTYNFPYDYHSVMHYPRNAFSKNGQSTILSKVDPEMQLGQRQGATFTDLGKIKKMYNCS